MARGDQRQDLLLTVGDASRLRERLGVEPHALAEALLDGTRDRAGVRAELQARMDLELSDSDLDDNLNELARLFLMER
jgi:hypothetical protein